MIELTPSLSCIPVVEDPDAKILYPVLVLFLAELPSTTSPPWPGSPQYPPRSACSALPSPAPPPPPADWAGHAGGRPAPGEEGVGAGDQDGDDVSSFDL